jgi:tRNA (guanosine-2'-O-)-methyltransferase
MTPERSDKLLRVLQKRQSGLAVVMENIDDPRNVTAVMRTCDAVGIQDVYILRNQPARQKKWSFKSGTSAAKWLSIHHFTDTTECITHLQQLYSNILTTHLSTEAVSLYELDLTKPTAIVFGNERFGVSEEMRKASTGNFLIPQVGIIQSLNISVACAVTIYEAFRQRSEAGMYDAISLPSERLQLLKNEWGFNHSNPNQQ